MAMRAARPLSELSDAYVVERAISKGAFGEVSLARALQTTDQRVVAIKKIRIQDADDDPTLPDCWMRREFELLHSLPRHENVVLLYDAFASPTQLAIVMEYCETTVRNMIRNGTIGDSEMLRRMCRQLLCGVAHCHAHGMLHRDLKPENLLVRDGTLKLGDFGLCRRMGVKGDMTPTVQTIWYRAPEVMLAVGEYGPAVDLWSCGCVVSEMARRKPLFAGDNEFEVLLRIFKVRGLPPEEGAVAQLPFYSAACFPKWRHADALAHLRSLHADCDLDAVDGVALVDRMLDLDAGTRMTAQQALQSAYFSAKEERKRRTREEDVAVECS